MHDFSHPSVANDVRAAGDGRPGPSRHATAANIAVAKLPYFDRRGLLAVLARLRVRYLPPPRLQLLYRTIRNGPTDTDATLTSLKEVRYTSARDSGLARAGASGSYGESLSRSDRWCYPTAAAPDDELARPRRGRRRRRLELRVGEGHLPLVLLVTVYAPP